MVERRKAHFINQDHVVAHQAVNDAALCSTVTYGAVARLALTSRRGDTLSSPAGSAIHALLDGLA